MKRYTFTIVKNLQENKEYLFSSLRENMKRKGIKITINKLKSLGFEVYKKTYYLP